LVGTGCIERYVAPGVRDQCQLPVGGSEGGAAAHHPDRRSGHTSTATSANAINGITAEYDSLSRRAATTASAVAPTSSSNAHPIVAATATRRERRSAMPVAMTSGTIRSSWSYDHA